MAKSIKEYETSYLEQELKRRQKKEKREEELKKQEHEQASRDALAKLQAKRIKHSIPAGKVSFILVASEFESLDEGVPAIRTLEAPETIYLQQELHWVVSEISLKALPSDFQDGYGIDTDFQSFINACSSRKLPIYTGSTLSSGIFDVRVENWLSDHVGCDVNDIIFFRTLKAAKKVAMAYIFDEICLLESKLTSIRRVRAKNLRPISGLINRPREQVRRPQEFKCDE